MFIFYEASIIAKNAKQGCKDHSSQYCKVSLKLCTKNEIKTTKPILPANDKTKGRYNNFLSILKIVHERYNNIEFESNHLDDIAQKIGTFHCAKNGRRGWNLFL